ncbi:hypothetical protein ABKN59_007525 [Abortiporus biennis]
MATALPTELVSSVFLSTDASLAHRARIASSVSSLRRINPRVPFWELAAHRIPTLWTLYRGMLRDAPHEDIRWRIRKIFEGNRHITSPAHAKRELLRGHRWAAIFSKAQNGDSHSRALLDRYNRMIIMKREKEHCKQLEREALEWEEKMRNRPIMTGGLMRASIYNDHHPRLRPQPIHITGMIVNRRKARQRRMDEQTDLLEGIRLIELEKRFETRLARYASRNHIPFEKVFTDDIENPHETWSYYSQMRVHEIHNIFDRDDARSNQPVPEELLESLKAARKELIANKTRELEREARGQVIRRTIRRSRKGPPAHVLDLMTERQKHLDKVSRSSVSEVGYVGLTKKLLGWKLKDPDVFKAEDGPNEDQRRLKELEMKIARENQRRRDQEMR